MPACDMIQSREAKQPPGYMLEIVDIFLEMGLEQVMTLDDDINRYHRTLRRCVVCEQQDGVARETQWHGRMQLCADCASGEPQPYTAPEEA